MLATIVTADVSHLVNQQPSSNYQYPSAAPENNPLSSYGVPQSSVLGNGAATVSYSSEPLSQSQLTLPSASGPSVDFVSRFSSSIPNGIPVETYNTFVNPPQLSADVSSFQVSTPAPSVQVSTSSPSVDFSSFQVSTPSPTPSSVNFIQYSQPPNSYQFLSSLSQPTVSIPSFGVSTPGVISQFNSGVSVNSNSDVGVQTSGGSLNDAFGVVTDAAAGSEASADSEVTKKLYFFAAPEDEEEEEIQARYDLPPQTPPKQTYKIIFIKAPTYRSKATITVPAPVANQERTLVYVLVKKPELHPTVRFQPSATATEAPKPEVFFIRYKTQKEAEAAVADIQSKHGASGEIVAKLAAGNQAPEGSTINIGGSDLGSSQVGVNVVSSTPAPISFNSRILETLGVNQPEVNQSALEVAIGRGGIAPAVTPVTFGQNSVDAQAVFGGGIASDRSVPEIESGNAANLSEIFASGNTASAQEENTTSVVGSTEATTVEEDSQNFVQQRVGDEAQGSQVVGFSAYGPPKY